MSCFVGNELDRVAEVVARLDRGSRIVYVSEAGMPVWSDPGARLVRAVVDAGHTIDVIPGPTAVATAVCLSGFTGSDVHFLGFPPRSGSARTEFLERVAGESGTTVCYEGPGRVCDLLRDLARVAGGARQAIVARELTKRHQEVLRGSLETLAARVTGALRGEVTLVVEGAREREQPSLAVERQAGAREVWAAICDPALKPRQRAKKIAAFTGLDTREIYTRLQTR
jgi:16S rRNA (cytidine1402-2'-O)-methyltransferase